MQKLSYFPAKDLKLPKDYSKSHVSIWVILHCFSSNFYVGWKISYSSLYFFCQIVMVCLWQFIAPQGALDIKQFFLYLSNCQSIVIKMMNFPTLLITTKNSNSMNQMSWYWCKKVKSCKNKFKKCLGAIVGHPPQKCTVSHCANGPGWALWQANYLLSLAFKGW